MIKKILITFSLLLLVACESPTTEVKEIDCTVFVTHKDCKTDVEPDPDPDPDTGLDPDLDPVDIEGIVIGTYTNQGATSTVSYDGRDIVTDACDHLENIGEWQPVWCDEFEYEGLPNSTLWNYDIGGNGFGNNELQFYTFEDEDNAFVDNGILTITAIKEYYSGNDYTSARLITKNTGDFLYGKIQVRAKVPAGRGTWPAIWMLPTNWEYGGWPTSGEIDIMEYVGYDDNAIHGTIHTGKYNHMLNTQVGKTIQIETAEEAFHVYEMDWEPGSIILYVDGVEYARFGYDPEDNTDVDSYEAWPFDKAFHLLINFAVGGNWGGAQGVDENIWPNEFLVDYVRVYQKDYVGMDNEAPSAVTNLESLKSTSNSIFLSWDHATDDVMVEEYKLYMNDTLVNTTTVNGHLFSDLAPSTAFNFKVIAVDFAGNESTALEATLSTSAPASISNRLEAEDFTAMYGIQIENTFDVGGGQNVGYIDDGDYLEYIVYVPTTGNYTVDIRYASQTNGANLKLFSDDVFLIDVNAPATYGWQTWWTTTSGQIYLTAGTHTFKVVASDSGFNLNYFEFEKVD